ncbi:hypothetical protein BD410DRAFT_731150 [Rickenella mellea]|uniref:Polysaccharide lyase 14 domain-containing protein n=1 Tax=Rickenella mellea TaxID=50990 RepID=A0A4Y7PP57_9AGAM|nr:hypothetical protein BD410DRAFT_731150 [Rickenella mellea]
MSHPDLRDESKLQDWLFPPSLSYKDGWTTSNFVNLPQVAKVDLCDEALGVHNIFSKTTHDVVDAPCSSKSQPAWEACYPQGSINPQGDIAGGFGFYMTGPAQFKEALATAHEIIMGYSVLFQEGWEWAKGGKIPGAYGGIGDLAYGCTGGRDEDRWSCFNLRMMWRSEGKGELYAYVPLDDDNIKTLSKIPPYSHRNPDYGFSVGRGSFIFPSGRWTTITQRVRLNNVGRSDAEIEIRVNGEAVINASGLRLRSSSESIMQGIHFQTFFGGNKADWASPKDQKAWFAHVSGAVIV